jgi:hypothetical protein
MGEQPLDGDLGRVRVRALDREPGEVPGHRVVEAELAGVAELQGGDTREELGDRADAVDGARRGGSAAGDVGEAEAAGPDELLVVDDGDGEAGDLLVRALAVEPDAGEVQRLGEPGVLGHRAPGRLCAGGCGRREERGRCERAAGPREERATHDASMGLSIEKLRGSRSR